MAKTTKIEALPNSKDMAMSAEEIAKGIEGLSRAMRTLFNSRLKREAIVALLAARSNVCKRDIEFVLNNLETLDTAWLKKAVT